MKAKNTLKSNIIGQTPSFVKRTDRFKTERNAKLFELLSKGLSINEIARVLYTTPQNVSRIIKEFGKYYMEESK